MSNATQHRNQIKATGELSRKRSGCFGLTFSLFTRSLRSFSLSQANELTGTELNATHAYSQTLASAGWSGITRVTHCMPNSSIIPVILNHFETHKSCTWALSRCQINEMLLLCGLKPKFIGGNKLLVPHKMIKWTKTEPNRTEPYQRSEKIIYIQCY